MKVITMGGPFDSVSPSTPSSSSLTLSSCFHCLYDRINSTENKEARQWDEGRLVSWCRESPVLQEDVTDNTGGTTKDKREAAGNDAKSLSFIISKLSRGNNTRKRERDMTWQPEMPSSSSSVESHQCHYHYILSFLKRQPLIWRCVCLSSIRWLLVMTVVSLAAHSRVHLVYFFLSWHHRPQRLFSKWTKCHLHEG